MANKGMKQGFSFGTSNFKKRKAIMRQGMTHCDLLLMQDTHLDAKLSKTLNRDSQGD